MVNMTAALRKALQTRSAEELARIEEHWAITNIMAESWSGTSGEEERGLQDIISARFAWAALSPNAREILHQIITFKVMDGVPREDLQALSGLAGAEFVAALAQLEQNAMLIEIRPDAKVRQRLEARSQKVGLVLAIPKDFYTIFTTIHQEIYGVYGDRSKMQLKEVLAALDPDKLQVM
ncbi:MAG TPA: hypothetical protein VN729_12335, partial [Ktedonobacteraceae bacterium]|nr:hypothetical protein [Ktedonobacteraceae bacterium]